MKLIKAYPRSPGSGKPINKEVELKDIKLVKYKFNNRIHPSKKVLFITCFSEFGCESLSLMYCIPKILEYFSDHYVICVGWYGREYLYRHLCDEYWEIKEEFQWLREYSSAFDNTSKNLFKLEKHLNNQGTLYRCLHMGRICLGNSCLDCKNFFGSSEESEVCPKCHSSNIERSLLANIFKSKKNAIKIPRPKLGELAKKYLKPNSVGIFARNRACYGRNLRPEFYVKLIKNLEDQGYNPVWLGEKQSTLPCPVDHIVDFSRLPEAKDLELTLSIVSQLKFTVQFWTASTRLASMMNVPWILFESEDQIYGKGQEGKRIALTTEFDKKKLVLSNYQTVMENEEMALDSVNQAIKEMFVDDNWEDLIGPGSIKEVVEMKSSGKKSWYYEG